MFFLKKENIWYVLLVFTIFLVSCGDGETKPKKTPISTSDAKCYIPCKTDLVVDDTIIKCSSEGLMEYCLEGTECRNGSCISTLSKDKNDKISEIAYIADNDNEGNSCESNCDCTDFQRCNEDGICESECESSSDCTDSKRCYRKVCRQECSNEISCPAGYFCNIESEDSGICMPECGSDDENNDENTHKMVVNKKIISFSNTFVNSTFTISHDSPFSETFTIKKVSHSWINEEGDLKKVKENSMSWIKIGVAGEESSEQEITVDVPAGDGLTINIIDTGDDVSTQWTGKIKIISEDMGERDLKLKYATLPEGQWSGKIYYFANFGDRNLDNWVADKSGSFSNIGNAFMQKWAAFRKGVLNYNEFNAILTATIDGSWNWKSVKDKCREENSENSVCYLYSDTDGNGGAYEYSSDILVDPIPSGLSVMPIAINLKKESTKSYEGTIVTSNSLHYPGDPKLTLSFKNDPLVCSNSGDTCLSYIDEMESNIYIGGRYVLKDGSCDSNFKTIKTPWLIPGFKANTIKQNNKTYKIECKSKLLPLGDTEEGLNTVFSSANPIPDGKYRKREIRLVDGMLVNQNRLFLVFKETVFLEVSDTTITSYGIIQLVRNPTTLGEDAYTSKSIEPGNNFTDDVLNISCSDEILEKYSGYSKNNMNVDRYERLANTLLYGSSPSDDIEPISGNEKVHYLCHDTKLFDGGHTIVVNDGTEDGYEEELYCPASSKITYFTLTNEPSDFGEDCNNNHNCTNKLNMLTDNNLYSIRLNPYWKCEDENEVFCDNNRGDLTEGKIFYKKATDVKLALPIASSVANAFRYKVRFQSRSGQTIGFSPEICQENSDEIPYCYDPEEIEEIQDRTDCLISIFDTYYNNNSFDNDIKNNIKNYLVESFSYIDNNGYIRDGFEKLNGELLIMLGDESYTKAFSSRFDLAGSGMKSFEGSLFEPNGIDLSGAAGYEMYNLYQATEYYQKVLDRFYRYSNIILESIKKGENDSNRNFITQETAVSYFTKLIRASTQKTRAWSEVAKRYQNFNKPELARMVIKRAYSSAYMESVMLSNMTQKLLSVTDATKKAQITKIINDSQLIYKAAFIDMRNVFDSITNDINYFGFSPEYMPFPTLNGDSANAFEKVYAAAEKKLEFANNKEKVALSDNRSYETDSASFQSELINIRNNYENELGDLCGYIKVKGVDGEKDKLYPAIPKYAYLDEKTKYLGNPCGYLGTGKIFQAMGKFEIELLNLEDALGGLDDNQAEINIEVNRHNQFCERNDKATGQYIETNDGETKIDKIINNIEMAQEIAGNTWDLAQGIAGGLESTNVIGSISANVVLGAGFAIKTVSDIATTTAINKMEDSRNALMNQQVKWDAENECEYDKIESNATIQTLLLDRGSIALESLKAQYRVRLAMAKISELRDKADKLISQQTETEQLAINIEASRNNPNVRIYKNDSIINADRAFYAAIKEAYKATKVFEYYTSSSYDKLSDLFLIRMVSHGDYNLENYLHELYDAFVVFEEEYGNPDNRLAIYSLKNDILNIPRMDTNGVVYTENERNRMLHDKLLDGSLFDKNGYVVIPFKTSLSRLSPITFNHKIKYLEAEIIGNNLGDKLGRVYLKQKGTSAVRPTEGDRLYYLFPERTAVINTIFNGNKWSGAVDIFKNDKFRDRPFVNTNYELVINTMDEFVNQDIKLSDINDIKIYIYYTDFTSY